MRFDRCVVPNSICGPSRASVLTGKYSHRNGFYNNTNSRFDGSQTTFPKLLQAAGYQTAIFGKWHLVSDPTGFDEWQILPGQGVYYHPPMIKNGRPVRQHRLHDRHHHRSEPRLAAQPRQVQALSAHVPAQGAAPRVAARPAPPGPRRRPPLSRAADLFDDYSGRGKAEHDQDMTIAGTMTAIDLKLTPPTILTAEERRVWDAYYEPRNAAFRAANLQGNDLVRWKYQRYLHDYLGCIKAVDESVGRLLSFLDEEGLAARYHRRLHVRPGLLSGRTRLVRQAVDLRGIAANAALVRWPGVVKPGSTNASLVSNIDFAETFLEAAGLPIPSRNARPKPRSAVKRRDVRRTGEKASTTSISSTPLRTTFALTMASSRAATNSSASTVPTSMSGSSSTWNKIRASFATSTLSRPTPRSSPT